MTLTVLTLIISVVALVVSTIALVNAVRNR